MSRSLILEVCRNRQVWQQNFFRKFVYKAKKVTKLDNLCIATKYVCTETLTHSEALWNHAFEFYLQLLSVSEDIKCFILREYIALKFESPHTGYFVWQLEALYISSICSGSPACFHSAHWQTLDTEARVAQEPTPTAISYPRNQCALRHCCW